MRFMAIVKGCETGEAPPPALVEAMNDLAGEAVKAGVFVDMGGLAPTASGARVRISNGAVTVTDGPFTEAKEVIGGYAIFDVASKAEIVAWTERFMKLHAEHWPSWEGETEIRQMAT